MSGYAPPAIARFYGLDLLRGVAALGVVLWHWGHFFWDGSGYSGYDSSQAPFAEALAIFYRRGSLGVDLFFALSGFIFAWLYATRIHEKKVGGKDFAVLRFSRLYPLHLATLLFVASVQWYRVDNGLIPFVYVLNDAQHFVLNLLFVSGWSMGFGLSFNGPAWSVSVEIFLYLAFFFLCRMFRPRLALWLGFAIAGFFIGKFVNPLLGRGLGEFYLGACMFLLYRAIASRPHRFAVIAAAIFLIGGWTITFASFALNFNEASVGAWYSQTFVSYQKEFLWLNHKLFSAWPLFFLFPLTILSLAILEPYIQPLARRMSFIGDVSYSSYLLHFPLQLIFVAVLERYAIDRAIVYQLPFLLGFFAALITLSLLSFHLFERPMQALIRARMTKRSDRLRRLTA